MGRGEGGNDALCTGNDLDWHSIHLDEWMRNVDERRVNLHHMPPEHNPLDNTCF